MLNVPPTCPTWLGTVLSLLLLITLAGCADKPEQRWTLTVQGAHSAAISPDGQYALVGSILHGGSLWRLKDGERLYNWNHQADSYTELVAGAFSTDSRYAVTAEKYRLAMWDVNTGRNQGFWSMDAGVRAVALSDQGALLLAGLDNYSLKYIDTRNGAILRTLNHDGRINTLAISGNGRLGISGAEDGMVKIWDLLEGKALHQFHLGDDVATVAISRDGRLAFGALYYGYGKIWNVGDGRELKKIGYSRNTLTAARFSADNQKLVTGDAVRRTIVWDVATGSLDSDRKADAPYFFRPSGRVIVDVQYDNSSGQLYSVFSDGSVYRW